MLWQRLQTCLHYGSVKAQDTTFLFFRGVAELLRRFLFGGSFFAPLLSAFALLPVVGSVPVGGLGLTTAPSTPLTVRGAVIVLPFTLLAFVLMLLALWTFVRLPFGGWAKVLATPHS